MNWKGCGKKMSYPNLKHCTGIRIKKPKEITRAPEKRHHFTFDIQRTVHRNIFL